MAWTRHTVVGAVSRYSRQLRHSDCVRWISDGPLEYVEMRLPFKVPKEVGAERFGAQCQEDNAGTEVYRFESVARHFPKTLPSALGFN